MGKIPQDVTESVVILEKLFHLLNFYKGYPLVLFLQVLCDLNGNRVKKGVIYWTYGDESIQKTLNPKKLNFPKATEVSA